jgi:hypothetical protein
VADFAAIMLTRRKSSPTLESIKAFSRVHSNHRRNHPDYPCPPHPHTPVASVQPCQVFYKCLPLGFIPLVVGVSLFFRVKPIFCKARDIVRYRSSPLAKPLEEKASLMPSQLGFYHHASSQIHEILPSQLFICSLPVPLFCLAL